MGVVFWLEVISSPEMMRGVGGTNLAGDDIISGDDQGRGDPKLQYGRLLRNILGWTRVPWVSLSFLNFAVSYGFVREFTARVPSVSYLIY